MRARPSFYEEEDAAFPGLQARLSVGRAATLLDRLARKTGYRLPRLSFSHGSDVHFATATRIHFLFGDLRPIVILHEWAHMIQQLEEPDSPHHGLHFATLVALMVEICEF